MKKLFVLLVGINDYPLPNPKLKGCIKDINQIEDYLHEFCSTDYDLQIRRLENQDATYDSVKKGFREHLAQAGPSDIAWFHFSGHGSEEKTAPEFLALEPNGKDQTLICIDSGVNGVNHLADKELAVMLNELGAKNPHLVVSLDCCHSGSGTRDAGADVAWSSRAAPSSGLSRTLDSYADGYYSKQKTLEVPSSKHVLLSACKSVQTAGDMPQGGAFTTGLVKALRASKGNVSYTDLFLRARASVQQVRDNQTPQFETILNFDPYTRFLDGSPAGERDLYEVIQKDGNWYVKCGAIHGLPTQPVAPIQLDIYSPPPEKELKASATIKSVGAQLSRIDMEGSFGVSNFLKKLVNDETYYRAALKYLPVPPEAAALKGDTDLIKPLIADPKQHPKNVIWAQEGDPVSLEVIVEDKGMTVMDQLRSNKAFTTDGVSQDHLQAVMDALDKIVFWRRFIELENKNRASQVKDMYEFELHEIDEEGKIIKHKPGDVRIYATSQQMSNRLPSFRPVVRMHNIQQTLYFYLFFVAYDYSVSCPGGEIVYRPREFDDDSNVEIPLWKKTLGWGPGKDNVEDTCYFKLLVTTEPLDYQQFLQSGLEAHRDILGEPTPEKVFDDWDASMVSVTMVRQDNAINAANEVTLADGNIKIKAHPSVSASVSIGVAEPNTRSTGAINAFSRLNHHQQLSMMDFSPSRSLQTQNVIEMDNISLANDQVLEEHPIEMTLNQKIEDDELMLPLAFDGHHFRIVGDASADAEGMQIRIHEIPDVDRSSDTGTGERGIMKSLKLTFCKVALGHTEVNLLQWVEFLPDGTIALQRENLGLKMGKAKKILLVLHGLAGDGLSMMKSLHENLPPENLKPYDLILTYDYESLNTPLDQTARALNKTLKDYGFGTTDRKLTIITHSLGGLISRWMIEQEGAKSFVEHCILVGTPNNGSLFGKIDAYRKWAQTACELAVNFIPSIIPFSGLMLKFFKTAADLGGSIAQIDPNSEFINKLNSSVDPGTRYTVISGDVSSMDKSDMNYSSYLEKAKSQIGRLVNQNEPNDLFAPVRSLQCKELWEGRNPENKILEPLANHHFGYFMSMGGTRDTNTIWKALNESL